MKPCLFVSFCLVVFSCSTNENGKEENVRILIESGQSYAYDLANETYTVFFIGKEPYTTRFRLTDAENADIAERYYRSGIAGMRNVSSAKDEVLIEDECMMSPKIYTTVTVTGSGAYKRIAIDEGCDDFRLSNFGRANAVKDFLDFVRKVVSSKPEVKRAPLSDIMYM